jgi:hypothetical protein
VIRAIDDGALRRMAAHPAIREVQSFVEEVNAADEMDNTDDEPLLSVRPEKVRRAS